jgi:hypothetical protein
VEHLKEISVQDLKFILSSGKFTSNKGLRVIRSYLKAAPQVYRSLPQGGFREWLLLAQKASFLSISCIEGFFDASGTIVEKGGCLFCTGGQNWGYP